MKEVILIGGIYHRTRHTIEDNQFSLKLPVGAAMYGQFEEYGSIASIYGIDELVPDNVFLFKEMEPVTFIRNLILDYCR